MAMSERGRLVTFEGGEGAGKSTQIRLLADRLAASGYRVRLLREPGGTAVGEAVRSILLDTAHAGMDPRAELLLYEAARAQLVGEVIEPALESGEIVLCDRFYDSTTAYQGFGRALDVQRVGDLNELATGGLRPDLTIVLDIDPRAGVTRATAHGADRLEAEGDSFHELVRSGFLEIAAREPERVIVIDGARSVDDVASDVWVAVSERLVPPEGAR